MKVTIDRDGCISCGNCEATCPQVFKLQVEGDGKAAIVEAYRKEDLSKGEVGEDLRTYVETARDSCPVQVISTTD
ncbi:MAG TPA: ferredoxin [Candidatus Krumholzibacteriaceae bacterium]|nr:ferredoxin [Candidatus Krumholzibacteriaceae bacterium]